MDGQGRVRPSDTGMANMGQDQKGAQEGCPKLLGLLHKVCVTANEAHGIDEAMQRCVDDICAFTGWSVGHVYTVIPGADGILKPRAIWHLDDPIGYSWFRQITDQTDFASGVGLPGRVLESGEPAWIRDVTTDANFPRARQAGDAGIKSGFALPVPIGNVVVAVLEFFSPRIDEPEPELMETLAHIGKQIGYVVEREQALTALKKSERSLREILDSVGEGIIRIDQGGAITNFNASAERMFGYRLSEVIGEDVSILIPEGERENHKKYVKNSNIHAPRIIDKVRELAGRRKDGSTFPMTLTVYPFAADYHRGFVGVMRDITRRRQAEEQSRRLQATIEMMPGIVALYDTDDRPVICNEGYRELNADVIETVEPGVPFEDHVRAAVGKGLVPEAVGREEEWIAGRLERRSGEGTAFEHERQDGRWLLITEKRLEDGSMILFSVDISELRRAEQDRQEALVKAEQASQAKSEFLATMSHELRTPLNAILGFSEILRNQYFGPLGEERYREYAEDIHASGDDLLALINDVLDISAIEAGKRPLIKEMIDLRDLVADCTHTVENATGENGLVFDILIDDDLPRLYADRRAVKQVLLNLLSNALKFTPADGYASVSVEANPTAVTITVADTGIGITPEDLPGLTDPFTRVVSDPKVAQEGAGLGLTIVKSLVDLHGGSVTIESQVDAGTKVTANFPNAAPPCEPAAEKAGGSAMESKTPN